MDCGKEKSKALNSLKDAYDKLKVVEGRIISLEKEITWRRFEALYKKEVIKLEINKVNDQVILF